MKKTMFFICFLAFLIILCALAFAQQNKGGGFSGSSGVQGGWYANSYALVVGINSYSNGWGRLSAGVSDAKKMAAALRARGFVVEELYDNDATSSAILSTLRKAALKTSVNDAFVFYYSGHGYTKSSEWDFTQVGYLVPVNARSGDISNYLSITSIREEILANCKAKHVLLVLDSCFSGTLLTRTSMNDGVVPDYLSKRGIYGITAGMQDQTALDGLFTSVLIGGMEGNADYNNDGYVSFKELGMYAEQNVKTRNRSQTPDYGVMYGAGQFVFQSPGQRPSAVAPPPIVVQPINAAPTYKTSGTNYDALAQAEQAKIDRERQQKEVTEKANRQARQQDIGQKYTKIKGYKQSSDYSSTAKKKVYKAFLDEFPTDNPYYNEVNGWYNEPDASQTGSAGIDWVYSKPAGIYFSRSEITVSQYRSCMESGACSKPNDKNDSKYCNWGYSDRDDHPINCVDWNQATAFCGWAGGRLLDENEWFAEASNGGSRTYPWGNQEVNCGLAIWGDGNNDGCGRDSTWPVCSKTAGNSVSGLCDMSGNVWEWTSSSEGSARVLRGGGWGNDVTEVLRAAARNGTGPGYRGSGFGLRCGRSSR